MKVMAILNITPDSFSDGGSYENLEQIGIQVNKFIAEGATIVDIGGESTRPGATAVSLEEELKRVLPIVKYVKENFEIEISIDTYKPEVARACLEQGVDYINDVRGTWNNQEMFDVACEYQCKYILMHCDPEFKQKAVIATKAIDDVVVSLNQSIEQLKATGYNLDNLIVDPGIGFYKNPEQSLSMLRHLDYMREQIRYPILLGTSRKSSLAVACGEQVASKRDVATAVTSTLAVMSNLDYVRVHNVYDNVQAIKTIEAIYEY